MNKISIITVCFNEKEEKIKYTFDSILCQSYHSIEFIVIDGGSRENTLNTLHAYMHKIDHFLSENDNGIFDAMNKGISLATGMWICFMNIGDAFYNYDALNSLMRSGYDSSEILYGDVYKTNFGLIKSPAKLNKYVFYSSGICHQAMISRKSVFEKIGRFDLNTNLYGDADWIMKAFTAGISFFYVPETVCIYEGGGATSDNTDLIKDRQNYLVKYYSYKERLIYNILSVLDRIMYRFINFDLRLPYFMKSWLKRLG